MKRHLLLKVYHGIKLYGFKNWLSLQSVRSISHIHVILKDVDDKFVDELISGGSGEVLTLDDYRNLE